MVVQLIVPNDLGGLRFDAALARMLPEHSRSRLQDWIRDGRVSVSGRVLLDTKYKLSGGEQIAVEPVAHPAGEDQEEGCRQRHNRKAQSSPMHSGLFPIYSFFLSGRRRAALATGRGPCLFSDNWPAPGLS